MNDPISANDATGVFGTTGGAATTFTGVLGTDKSGTNPVITPGGTNDIGVYGVTSTTTGTSAGVIGEAPAGGTAFWVSQVTTGTGLNANSVISGTAISATGVTSGTALAVTGLTSGTGVNVGTSITSGNGAYWICRNGGFGFCIECNE